MTKFSETYLVVATCVALFIMQLIFMFIPVAALGFFNMAVRPVVFIVLAVACFGVLGRDMRYVYNVFSINVAVIITIAIFGLALLIFSVMFGVVANGIAPDNVTRLSHLWNTGTVIVFGEYIRIKLIKSSSQINRAGIIVAITLVLAFTHMGGIRVLVGADSIGLDVVFNSIIRPLVISSSASFFAIKGTFASVLIVSFTYTMATLLLPVIPDVSILTFSIITSGSMFASIILYAFLTSDRSREKRAKERRMARYTRRPWVSTTIILVVVVVLFAFFVGTFRIYPIVVLTSSMEPTLPRGSIAFIERVSSNMVYDMVVEGYVIHFISREGVEFIHRNVGYWYDHANVRHYLTQGDAGGPQDPNPVPPEDVRGIARMTLPYAGFIYIFFRNITSTFN